MYFIAFYYLLLLSLLKLPFVSVVLLFIFVFRTADIVSDMNFVAIVSLCGRVCGCVLRLTTVCDFMCDISDFASKK